jgi:hypothetical protein
MIRPRRVNQSLKIYAPEHRLRPFILKSRAIRAKTRRFTAWGRVVFYVHDVYE